MKKLIFSLRLESINVVIVDIIENYD